ncbi:hypothetical protein A464_1154 [Salmonella bongori N268-08]|uniref:Uncharacterized protein n=1 Tax=Salmonella bongori N268-08 TaxID=1197719 RepID=S5N716_SALBN|nr:hypothetical protein A464_1154 [Salmonella bongori N268-08]
MFVSVILKNVGKSNHLCVPPRLSGALSGGFNLLIDNDRG